MNSQAFELSRTDLATLVDLAPELTEDTALASLLGRLLESAVKLTSSTAGSVYLYDERRRSLYVAHAVGPEASVVLAKYGAAATEKIPIVGSKAGGVFASGEPIVVNAVAEDPEHFKAVDKDTARPTSSMIAVPLIVAGERIGVVQLINRTTGPYTGYEVALLGKFANLAAVAVRNARLFGELAAHMGAYGTADTLDAAALRRQLMAPAELERVTVLFADMRGYTQLEQTLRQPEFLQARLNEFLALLANAVIEHGGVVNKFLGDGLMALFRGTAQEIRAVRCAQDIVDGFATLRDRWDVEINESIGFLDVGVGIATDMVMLGTVGTDRVREFTAIGRGVSLASVLMQNAREGRRILTDRITFRAVSAIVEESRGPTMMELKNFGLGGPRYEVYEIIRLRSATAPAAQSPTLVASASTTAAAPASPGSRVFVSYSHADRSWLDEFHTHLRPFLRREEFDIWDDSRIAAGDQWRQGIESALAHSGAAVLLVSPTFLSSEFIDRHELPPLIEAARRRGLRIFWVPVSSSAYDETEIASFQAAHDPRRPLDQLAVAERNAAWVKICREIAGALRAGS